MPRAMGGQFGHRTATGRDPRPGPCRLGQGGHIRDDDASVLGMRIKRGQLSGSHGARTVPTSRPACAKRRVAGVRIPNASRVRRRRGRARQCMECSGSLALLGQRHAARRPTDPPLPSKPVPRPTLFRCSPEDIAPQMAIFHPRPGRVSPTKRQGPEHSKASPVGPLPPRSRRGAGGRQKTEIRPRVGRFTSKECHSHFKQASTFPRFVPVGAAGTSRDNGFFLGFLSRAPKR